MSLCIITVIALFSCFYLAKTACPDNCNLHGRCQQDLTCICDQGWMGPSCKSRSCPTGTAWVDVASATDTAHAVAECSNMGLCNRSTGECTCRTGFSGINCGRIDCPGTGCNGNGKCMSLREVATHTDDINYFVSTTYSRWDADMIHGCVCDAGYFGYDCSLKQCMKGDDPLTTGVSEIQDFICTCQNTCSGTFTFSFRGETTTDIAYGATAATVETALDNLSSLYDVDVSYNSGTAACTDGGTNTISVTFTHVYGDIPDMTFTTTLLTSSGATPSVSISENRAGTTEDLECSNRGTCNSISGKCTCMTSFTSSDGAGATGYRPDCGYNNVAISQCQVSLGQQCSGHGTCSGATTYTCSCVDGYTGFDCSERTCPRGHAWFDEPTATDTAHALAECSNRGICDRLTGKCTCASGFSGDSCQRLECPATTTGSYCSGHGVCLSMQFLAEQADNNGDSTSITYGDTPGQMDTWDARKIFGCRCDSPSHSFPEGVLGNVNDYIGYDCSLRTCATGDDPSTINGIFEVQTFRCFGNPASGTFTLSFRQQTTSAINYNDDTSSIKTALENLQTIGQVVVSYDSGSVACGTVASPVTVSVTFTDDLGDLPLLSGTHSGGTLTLDTFTEATPGTKENVECSNRGTCDRASGLCTCFKGYASSDGDGGLGRRGDCGHVTELVTS